MAKKQPSAASAGVARVKLITGAQAISGAILSISRRAQKLDQDIHVAALSVLVHSAQHNDPDIANRLVEALGKSMRKQALIGWMCAYGAFTLDDSGKLAYNVKRRDAVLSDENVAAAEAEPFWDFMPEKPYAQFDLAKALAALLAKAEKALTVDEQDAALISPEKLAALRALTNEGAAE